MPIVVPPFVAYQVPLYPLRGLWNTAPGEGDRFVSAEIDWGVMTGAGEAVQFALSGNSPVAFSQIVAFAVDNSRCGGDLQFLFPDSGFILQVPAYNQGVYPVFTNALMFYAMSPNATTGDVTVFQVFNSMPPPVSIAPTEEQATTANVGFSLSANAYTQIVPATVSGTVESVQMLFSGLSNTTAQTALATLQDGTGHIIWQSNINALANAGVTLPVTFGPVNVRFFQGVRMQVSGTSFIAGGAGSVNLYYSVP
jgi:hypothetical protein